MPAYEPLNTAKHKNFSINQDFPLEFCKKDTYCHLLSEETERVATLAPIVFLKNGQGSFNLVMLLSLEPEKNHFLNNSLRWTGTYIPAAYRCYPFALLEEEKSKKKILGFDTTFSIITDTPTEKSIRLFKEDGSNSKHLTNVVGFLNAIQEKRQETIKITEKIKQLDILEEWKIQLIHKDQKQNVAGLWKISKEKFNALDKKQYNNLREVGALPVVYNHFVSLFTLNNLTAAQKDLPNSGSRTLVDRTKEKQAKESKENVDTLVNNLLSEN